MRHKKQLLIVLLVVFTSFFAIALQYPILAPLFLSPDSQFAFAGLPAETLYGIAIASFPLGQFLGTPIIGTCSDFWGRRKTFITLVAMLSFGFTFSIYAIYCTNFLLFSLSRFFCGFWEGIVPLSRAIATDLDKDLPKAKTFGFINASVTTAYLVGPFTAGIISLNLSSSMKPVIIYALSSVISLISLSVIFSLFTETQDQNRKRDIHELGNSIRKKISSITEPLFVESYRKLFFMSCLITVSFNLYYKFIPAILVKKFHCLTHNIALSTIVLASSMILSQLYINTKLSKSFESKFLIDKAGIILSALFIMAALANNYYLILLINIPLGIVIGIIGINIPIFISNNTPKQSQGQIMGLMMSLKYLGESTMTVFCGFLSVYNISIPIYFASLIVAAGLLIFARHTRVLATSRGC